MHKTLKLSLKILFFTILQVGVFPAYSRKKISVRSVKTEKGKLNSSVRSEVLRKPYVQNVTPTGLSILWETSIEETDMAGLVSANPENSWKKASINKRYHEVRFTGLVPDTVYHYKIKTSSGIWKGKVKTAITGDSPFSFLIIGDNRHGHSAHRAVIERMSMENADFYVNTGDMVNTGLKLRNWYRFFRIEYPLMKTIPVFPAVGNHEDAFGKGAEYYRRFFALPENGPQKEMTYFFTWGNSRFFFLNTNTPFIGTEQTAWLKSQFVKTAMDEKIKHIFVVVHQSPYTSGPHGPQRELLNSGLVEDFKKFGVDMIIAGHDHIYERGRVDNLNYVISGGGGAPIYFVKNNNTGSSLVSEATYHYCKVVVRGDTIDFSAMRTDGSLLDYMVLKKRHLKSGKHKIEVVGEMKRPGKKPVPKADNSGDQVSHTPPMHHPQKRSWFFIFLMIGIGVISGLVLAIILKRRKN